jgi:hypothetical protein
VEECARFEGFASLYLEGPAGAGKTTVAIARIRRLMAEGVPPESILLLAPQRSYMRVYEAAFSPEEGYRLGRATVGGLARRYVDLFWPEISGPAGFAQDRPPRFLTYEQAQYVMSTVVEPLIVRGAFAGTALTRPRLYSQLIDNMNKVAAHGLGMDRLPEYLRDVALGERGSPATTDDSLEAIAGYRAYCRAHGLVDFAESLALFAGMATQESPARRHVLERYRHLVADNLEEDIPIAHDLLIDWIPDFESALVVVDTEGSYRLFMGASDGSARRLAGVCERNHVLREVAAAPAPLQRFADAWVRAVDGKPAEADDSAEAVPATVYVDRLHHAMIDRAGACVARLVEAGVPPAEIAVIAPVLGDHVSYNLALHLEKRGIGSYTHRPSRPLHDEPVVRVMLTLAALAHPTWDPPPVREEVAHLFYRVLDGCDLVRASLLAGAVVPSVSEGVRLLPFETVDSALRERITYRIGEGYERLRTWVERVAASPPAPLDHFFQRAFGEVLSQPGFGFHREAAGEGPAAAEGGQWVGALAESAARFRQAAADTDLDRVGMAYRAMVQQGVISAFYAFEWEEPPDRVLLAPVHTFLLRNRPVCAQVWLDVGSPAWHRRINQPLTNPYIVNRDWEPGAGAWDDRAEQAFEKQRLCHAVYGLIRRCTGEVHLFVSALSPSGRDQKGRLLRALSRAAQSVPVAVHREESGPAP